MDAVIAQHLNVSSDAIIEIQVWAKVLWVRVRGLGCRFVSKKVVKMTAYQVMNNAGNWEDIDDAKLQALAQRAYTTFSGRYQSIDEVIAKIPDGRVYYDTEWYAQLRVKPAPRKVQQPKEQVMTTSTGRIVDADEWDRIEGEM